MVWGMDFNTSEECVDGTNTNQGHRLIITIGVIHEIPVSSTRLFLIADWIKYDFIENIWMDWGDQSTIFNYTFVNFV